LPITGTVYTSDWVWKYIRPLWAAIAAECPSSLQTGIDRLFTQKKNMYKSKYISNS